MKNVIFGLALLILIILKIYLYLQLGPTTPEYLHLYRAGSLLRYGRDEIGNPLPPLFHGPTGYQLPLLDYLLVPVPSGLIFDLLLWLLPAALVLVAFRSHFLGLVFLAQPLFLWPGSWPAKLFLFLVTVFLLALRRRAVLPAAIVVLLCLETVTDAYLLLPLFLLGLIFFRPYRRFSLQVFSITLFLILAIGLLTARVPGIRQSFVAAHFGLFTNPQVTTTINSLRGEHLLSRTSYLSKLLHNKLTFGYIILQNSARILNPSFLFGLGDKDPFSSSQKIPPLLIVLLPFLFISLFHLRRLPRPILWLTAVSLLIVSLPSTVPIESQLFIFSLSLCFLITSHLTPRLFLSAAAVSLLLLVPMVYFSIHYLPPLVWVARSGGLENIIRLSRDNSPTPLLLADDVYPDPGPFLAYSMRIPPPVNLQPKYHYRNYLRQVNNIEIVSPTDPRLTALDVIPVVATGQLRQYISNPLDRWDTVVSDPFNHPLLSRLIYAKPKI